MSAASWQPVDLVPIIAGIEAGEIVGPVPAYMPRTDGVGLLYGGEVHSLSGEPESCKGWITLRTASSCLMAGEGVLYLDFEDAAASIIGRLLALGTVAEQIAAQFVYVRPCDPFKPEALTALLDGRSYALGIADGLSEAYGLLGLDPYSNADAAKFLAALPRPIAERGAAVLLIDHVIKNREARGRFAIGAQHKLAGIAAAYSAEVIRAPSRAHAGLVKIKIEKDRHGHVRAHAEGGVIALAHIEPSDGGESVIVRLEPPDATGGAGVFRPTVLMGRVAAYLAENPGASRNAVIRDVSGKRTGLDEALRVLISEGYVERRQEGQAHHHYPLRTYEDADRGTEAQPRPNRGPAQLLATEAPRPAPRRGRPAGPGDNGHADSGDRGPGADGISEAEYVARFRKREGLV